MNANPHPIPVPDQSSGVADPAVPKHLRNELAAELAAARATDDPGRERDAELALGERREPWNEPPSTVALQARITATIRALLRHRNPEATICLTDAAQVVANRGWRDVMPDAREVAGTLAQDGILRITQRTQEVDPVSATGPIRLGRGTKWNQFIN